jgi:hypothetical protein
MLRIAPDRAPASVSRRDRLRKEVPQHDRPDEDLSDRHHVHGLHDAIDQ